MTNEVFADKRLLEALDYIDERFIAEVTEDYEIFDLPGEYKPNRKRTFRAYRQFAALAACLILLSGAFPVIVRFVSTAIDSIAGLGSGTTEENSLELDSTEIDSPYERAIDAYPADMPINEIYADVLKGGWAVSSNMHQSDFVEGKELWLEFLDDVNNEMPTSVLLADYVNYYADFMDYGVRLKERRTTIYLMEIVYDGQIFHYRRMDARTDEITDTGAYKYLVTDIYDYDDNGSNVIKSGYRESYCLTNDSEWTYQNFINIISSETYPSKEFFSNPCQVVAMFETVYVWHAGMEGAASITGSIGFSEILLDY